MDLDIITGSSGFIGRNLINNKKNKKFIGIDKTPFKSKTNINSLISKINFPKITKNFNIKNIYHFGGHSNLSYLENHNLSFKEDLDSILNILNFLNMPGNEKVRLIYASSSYIYQNSKLKKKVKEDNKISPNNSFGFAKKIFEEIIQFRHKN